MLQEKALEKADYHLLCSELRDQYEPHISKTTQGASALALNR